jgi:hypothetical protein
MMDYTIATERLELQLMRKSDADNILQLHTEDPGALRFIDCAKRLDSKGLLEDSVFFDRAFLFSTHMAHG